MISQFRLVLTSSDVAKSHSNLTKHNSHCSRDTWSTI